MEANVNKSFRKGGQIKENLKISRNKSGTAVLMIFRKLRRKAFIMGRDVNSGQSEQPFRRKVNHL